MIEKTSEVDSSIEPRKLPNMNEFSPGVGGMKLASLLDIVKSNEGNNNELLDALAKAFINTIGNPKQRIQRASNILIGMSQCGLFDLNTRTLTEIGNAIQIESSHTKKNETFAFHLLKNCYGLELLDAIRMLQDRGESVTLNSIREELRTRGFEVTENAGDSSKIRLWLEPTMIINESWEIDEERLHALIGASTSVLSEWKGLTRGQRAFLKELKDLSFGTPGVPVLVRTVKNLSEDRWGRQVFPEGHLRAEVIRPLADAGWIDEETPKSPGHGGDSGRVIAKEKLIDIALDLPVNAPFGIPTDLRDKLKAPLSQIFDNLNSSSTYIKGIALELLSLRLIRDIGLYPQAFRLRSEKTQGAEVDLIANGLHLHYSRWLFQCKNTKSVGVHDLAKEVGMAVLLKANVIAMVTTGKFSSTVRQYATGLAQSSALQTILIDGAVLNAYKRQGSNAIIDFLRKSAGSVLRLKECQVTDIEE